MDILTAFHYMLTLSTCDWCRKICSYDEPVMPVKSDNRIYFVCTYCRMGI